MCPTYTRPNASAWPLLVIQSIVAHICPVTSVRKFFSPSPSRLGYFKQQFIVSMSAMSHAFSGPRFPFAVALRSVAHGCKGALLQPWRAQGRGSVRRPRRLAQLVDYPTPPRGGLRLVSYCPRLRPWAGLVALCCKPAGGGGLGGLGGLVDGLGLSLGGLGGLSLGLGLRLALGLALCSRGAAYSLGNKFAD